MSTTSDAPYTSVAQADRQVRYLERLGLELENRGLRIRINSSPGHSPRLHVLNPDMAALNEDIRVEFALDGWFYVWSWAERICSAEDVTGAADVVVRVLYV